MPSASLSRFSERAAAHRAGLFGVEFTDQTTGRKFTGALAAVNSSRELAEGGWQPTVTSTLRVRRAALSAIGIIPTLGRIVFRPGAYFRIDQIRDNPVSPEWVFGLADDESRP